ncbi:MAG: CHAT domain-containing protein [Bacteroidota bacterium]
MENIIKVLFLASDPSDASRLHLGRELKVIREKLDHNKLFDIKDNPATTPKDLMDQITNYQPQIVHFSGHGSADGELCFEDELGKSKTISPEALASFFSIAKDYVKCVVVNTCFSEKQAKAISQHIPVVVGTKKEISDDAAINFSSGFYTALNPDLSTENFNKAFGLGLVAIQFDETWKNILPLLLSSVQLN